MKRIYLSPSNQYANTYATGNTNEMAQCNRIAEAAKTALKRCGFEVKKAPQGQNMYTSINESNAFKADLHIPIHTNAGGGKGVEVFIHSTKSPNIDVGKAIYKRLVEVAPSKTGRYIGVYRYGGTLAEIENTNAITVYCECEYHDNKTYAEGIIKNVTKIGEAICKGVCDYYKVKYKPSTSTATVTKPAPATKPTTSKFKSYKVKITANDGVNIRKGAGTNYAIVNAIPKGGIYTIVDEKKNGGIKWGKLKSGAGWIALNYTKKI